MTARQRVSKSKIGRLNQRNRDSWYDYLVERDGERCRVCGRYGRKAQGKNTLIVDCIDNSGDHSDAENLQLLCKRHNTKKNPRGLGRFNPLNRSLSVDEVEPKKVTSAEMQKNLDCEPRFRDWLYRLMKKHNGEVSYSADLVDSAAEYCHCSQQTIKRYLSKTTSSTGWAVLEEEGGTSTIRWRSSKKNSPAGSNGESEIDTDVLAESLTGPP